MDSDEVSARSGSGLNILAGLWLIIAPFILGYSASVARTNDLWLGIIVLALALIGVAGASISWSRWINMAAGIWLIIAPFVLHYSSLTAALWNDIILGVLVIGFSAWSVSAANVHKHHQAPQV